MRSVAVLALVAVVGSSGCFSGGCWVSERAEAWHQAEYWDWQPGPGRGLQVGGQAVEPRWPWPDPPASWRGNHSVRGVGLTIEGQALPSTGYGVSIGESMGEMSVGGFVPQKMGPDETAALLRRLLEEATTASEIEVADLVAKALAGNHGEDKAGRILGVPAPGLAFDLEALAAKGDWTTAQQRAGGWELSLGAWEVMVELESRSVSASPGQRIELDSGGYVRGPMLGEDLTDAERRGATTALLASWGAPVPTYAEASVVEQQECT